MKIKSPLSVYDVLGSKAGGPTLCQEIYKEAARQGLDMGKQYSHDPRFKESNNYDLVFLLNFLAIFRSDENNRSKVTPKIWDAIPKRLKKYRKELGAQNQLSLFE